MINVLPLNDADKIKKYFNNGRFEFNCNSGCIVATDKDSVLGFCTYYLYDDCIKIADIKPDDDLMLADGILRSALHVADFKGIINAFYMDNSNEELLSKLKFIKNRDDRTLNIEKLHESCCSC